MIKYDSFVTTLKETSKDTSSSSDSEQNIYMTESDFKVVNFDLFQEAYLKNNCPSAKKPSSVDAFCMLNGKWCLIEFKNRSYKSSEIREKIGSSVSIVTFKGNIEPENFKNNSIFILVYNKKYRFNKEESYLHQNEHLYLESKQISHSKTLDSLVAMIAKKAKTPIIIDGLEAFKGIYFKEVMTMDQEIFNKYISDKNFEIPRD